jgi:hypothetical protein
VDTLILAAMAVAVAVSLVVIVGRLLVRRREEREQWERDGRPEPAERTPEQKERDRRTSIARGRARGARARVLGESLSDDRSVRALTLRSGWSGDP